MNRFMLRAAACVVLLAGTHVCTLAQESRALVVINDNSSDSVAVGNYYATSRNIPTDHIVHVRVPNQQYVQLADYVSLRDQILRFGLCPLVAAANRPAACSDVSAPIYTQDTIDALTAHAPVGYIVLTKGVPTRFPSSSVDSYLRFTLANYLPVGGVYTSGDLDLLKGRREANLSQDVAGRKRTLTSQIAALRPVDVAQDREYIVGRIDNLDLTTAKAMVDKTLAAQSAGLQGKVYSNRGGFIATLPKPDVRFYNYPGADTETWRQMFGFFGESRLSCIDYDHNYLSVKPPTGSNVVPVGGQAPSACWVKISDGLGESVGSWGGTTYDQMPGNSGSRQPIVDNALIYFGQLDGQSPQGDLAALLNWRKNLSCTNTLCDTAADPAACRAASTDPYKQIDTSCVGVAPGFVGYNERSFTAAHFGIWPQPWGPVSQYGVSDAPRVDATQGADGSYSVWFDYQDDVASPLCYPVDNVNGNAQLGLSTVSCVPRRMPSLAQDLVLSSPGLADKYDVSLSFKALGLSSAVTQQLKISMSFSAPLPSGVCVGDWKPWPKETAPCRYTVTKTVDIANTSAWQSFTGKFELPGGMIPDQGALEIEANDGAGLQVRALGLDAISVKRTGSATELVVNGSFSHPGQYAQIKNASGAVATANDRGANFVAHFLGRLGATAFLGSTGHGASPWNSEGHSFESHDTRNVWMWMNGIPLGDAVWLGEPVDGVFYGDPLYSPMTVGFTNYDDFDGHLGGSVSMSGVAYNGTADLVKAESHICTGNDAYVCDLANSWRALPDPVITGAVNLFKQSVVADSTSMPSVGEYIVRERFTFRSFPGTGQFHVLNTFGSVINKYTQAEQAVFLIKGAVKTPKGLPMEGVAIALARAGQTVATAKTDLNGAYVLEQLVPGDYTITAANSSSSDSYVFSRASGSSSLTIALSSLSAIDFIGAISGGATVSGVVRNASDSDPIAGVDVTAYSGATPLRSWLTDKNGAYELQGLPAGAYIIRIADAHWLAQKSITLANVNQTVDLSSTPASGSFITGYTKDAAGNPVAGQTISVINCNDGDGGYVKTNARGYFKFPGLSTTDTSSSSGCPAQTAAIQVRPTPDWTPSKTGFIKVSLAGSVTLAMNPAHPAPLRAISGYAYTSGTTTVRSGISLSLVDQAGNVVGTATTTRGGFYKFSGIPSGVYTIKQGTVVKASPSVVEADAINVNLAI